MEPKADKDGSPCHSRESNALVLGLSVTCDQGEGSTLGCPVVLVRVYQLDDEKEPTKAIGLKDLMAQRPLLLRCLDPNRDGGVFDTEPHVVVCGLGTAEVCRYGIRGMPSNKVAKTPVPMAPEVWKCRCRPEIDKVLDHRVEATEVGHRPRQEREQQS